MPLIAQHAGTCPACGRYFAKGRSKIEPLPVALPADPVWTTYHPRHGFLVKGGPSRRAYGGSVWIHAACEQALRARFPDERALTEEATRRRAVLTAKRVHEEAYG